MKRGTVYAGMDTAEAKRIAVMRTYYRTKGVDLDPHRVRLVLSVRDHVRHVLNDLQPDERKMVLGMLTRGRVRRRRKRAD